MTKDEKAWVKKIQKLLDNPPSERLGFYTIGDQDVAIYDRSKDDEIYESFDVGNSDFCTVVQSLDAGLGILVFPSQVHSTAG